MQNLKILCLKVDACIDLFIMLNNCPTELEIELVGIISVDHLIVAGQYLLDLISFIVFVYEHLFLSIPLLHYHSMITHQNNS